MCPGRLVPVGGEEEERRLLASLESPWESPPEEREPRLPDEEALEQMELVRFRGTFWASERRTMPGGGGADWRGIDGRKQQMNGWVISIYLTDAGLKLLMQN